MRDLTNLLGMALAIVLGIGLQLVFAAWEYNNDSPALGAMEFTRHYFKASSCMTKRLCKDSASKNGVNVVNAYIDRKVREANERGFNLFYLKKKLYEVDTVTSLDEKDRNRATVEIVFKTKPPLKSFFTKETKVPGKGFLPMIKEDGRWKVCGDFEKLFDV